MYCALTGAQCGIRPSKIKLASGCCLTPVLGENQASLPNACHLTTEPLLQLLKLHLNFVALQTVLIFSGFSYHMLIFKGRVGCYN